MIGIITATEEEFAALKQIMPQARSVKGHAGMEFLVGTLGTVEVVGVQAGIGKVNAAVCTQVMIDRFEPEKIINVGVAGALNPELHVGDIVISTDAAQHDFDTTFFGDEPGYITGLPGVYMPADEALKNLASRAAERLGLRYRRGRVVTGDQFVAAPEKKAYLVTQFQGDCTEMEGGAIAQTCQLNQVPFVIIRAISDGADDGAPMQYEEFVHLAAARAMELIQTMLKEIE